ncbi:hypothetical protein ACQKMI_03695 [Lysinibacillus sp. NPDC097214]|uniref:hypothetical protein n=1 Tax=Lysinibacillus sp. NPDC097214 TaxID=3390584 RepID=UPI003D05A474
MFFARKRSDSNTVLSVRQQQQHEGRHDVGHFGNATGRGVLSLSSSISVGVGTLAERSEKNLTTFDLLRIMRY